MTTLHAACYFGLKVIFSAGFARGPISANAATEMGTTPIIIAASCGHVSIVTELLHRDVNPYLSNWYGSALHYAAEAGHSDIIHELVRYEMSLTRVNVTGGIS